MKRCGLYSETAAQIVTGCFERNSSKFVISFLFFPLFLSQKYDSPEICEIRRLVQIIHQQVKRICSF